MGKYESQYCEELAKRIAVEKLEDSYYFPKFFTIETCNNCNAKCIMCPKGQKGTSSLQLMDDSLFEKIVEEIRHYSDWIEMICLNSDGEPLLDKKIGWKIKRLKEIGIKHVNISTNAQLLTTETIQEFINYGLDDIRISLDGYTKETFEKIRVGLDYEQIKNNVLQLIQMRNQANSPMAIRVRMVELEQNREEREEWQKYWRSKLSKIDKVQLMPMHTWSGKIAEEEQKRIEYYADRPCVSVFSSFPVNYDGKVQLCDSDIEQQMIMGDIKAQTIKEIWQGEKFEIIRGWHANAERNKVEICRGCDHWSREFKEDV